MFLGRPWLSPRTDWGIEPLCIGDGLLCIRIQDCSGDTSGLRRSWLLRNRDACQQGEYDQEAHLCLPVNSGPFYSYPNSCSELENPVYE
jgi:hypothetical protein